MECEVTWSRIGAGTSVGLSATEMSSTCQPSAAPEVFVVMRKRTRTSSNKVQAERSKRSRSHPPELPLV